MGAVVRAELTKLCTLRFWWIALTVAVVGAGALGAATGFTGRALAARADAAAEAYLSAGYLAIGTYLVVPFCVLGALTASSEYPHRARAAVLAMPRRSRLLAGKVAALLIVTVPGALVTVLVSCLAAELGLGAAGSWVWATPGQVLGATAHLVVLAVVAFGFALACRSAVAVLVVMIGLSQAGIALLQQTPLRSATAYLPDLAGVAAFFDHDVFFAGDMSMFDTPLPWATALAVVFGWVVLALGAGALRFVGTDA